MSVIKKVRFMGLSTNNGLTWEHEYTFEDADHHDYIVSDEAGNVFVAKRGLFDVTEEEFSYLDWYIDDTDECVSEPSAISTKESKYLEYSARRVWKDILEEEANIKAERKLAVRVYGDEQ